MQLSNTAVLFMAWTVTSASAFAPASTVPVSKFSSTQQFETAQQDDVAAAAAAGTSASVPMPQSYSEMIRQMSGAMRDANEKGINRQIVRVCLPRSADNANLGIYDEGLLDLDSQNIVLVPLDESWQGGIMQLYYSALPTMSDALRLFTENGSGVPPRIEEDRSIDESGVDGVSVLKAVIDKKDIRCFIQPSQETVEDFVDAEAQKSDNMVVLLNPQWRVTDDWFDGVSRTDKGFFGQVAGFLGGKGATLRRLAELQFEPVYNVEGYVCRGWNVRMVKRFDTDYTVYVDSEDGTYKQLGMSSERPTYQDSEKWLDEAGFNIRYTEGLY